MQVFGDKKPYLQIHRVEGLAASPRSAASNCIPETENRISPDFISLIRSDVVASGRMRISVRCSNILHNEIRERQRKPKDS